MKRCLFLVLAGVLAVSLLLASCGGTSEKTYMQNLTNDLAALGQVGSQMGNLKSLNAQAAYNTLHDMDGKLSAMKAPTDRTAKVGAQLLALVQALEKATKAYMSGDPSAGALFLQATMGMSTLDKQMTDLGNAIKSLDQELRIKTL